MKLILHVYLIKRVTIDHTRFDRSEMTLISISSIDYINNIRKREIHILDMKAEKWNHINYF